jgi:hydroxymethylbilane synthase
MTTTVAGPRDVADPLAQVLGELLAGRRLRVGTRLSPMALAQAEMVRALIRRRVPGVEVELAGVETSADLWPGDLHELGGKGNFTSEIDKRLVGEDIDLAVHCLKDVPGDVPLPDGAVTAAYLPRDDVHDVAVFPAGSKFTRLEELPAGSVIGTSSVRRRAQLGRWRPDLRVEPCRGNVNNRLKGLDENGRFTAMILARAGLGRIGMADRPHELLPIEQRSGRSGLSIVPAVGAGVLALQARSTDVAVMLLAQEFNDPTTAECVTAERVMLRTLMGHCNSPIAGYATHAPDGRLGLRGLVFNRDGSEFVHAAVWHRDPEAPGSMVGSDLLRRGAGELIAATNRTGSDCPPRRV